uniref:Ribosomal protein S19 n=1 Tax=Physarum polycephalum TaxID=5791 RepID=F2Y9V0_PHYPO|nr:ribosomal protein S19 [Physarum polycephalum]
MKVPFVNYELLTKVIKESSIQALDENIKDEHKPVIQTKSRSSTIINPFVGKVIAVYTGARSKRIYVTSRMVGFKLGCFAFTKKLGKSIHNSEHNRKKIAKMKRKITQKKVRKTVVKTVKKPTKKKK